MSRMTYNTRQLRTDSIILGLAMMAITAAVWLVTRLLSR